MAAAKARTPILRGRVTTMRTAVGVYGSGLVSTLPGIRLNPTNAADFMMVRFSTMLLESVAGLYLLLV
jgi:hypothetical protein